MFSSRKNGSELILKVKMWKKIKEKKDKEIQGLSHLNHFHHFSHTTLAVLGNIGDFLCTSLHKNAPQPFSSLFAHFPSSFLSLIWTLGCSLFCRLFYPCQDSPLLHPRIIQKFADSVIYFKIYYFIYII